jgi:hypothetical protein
MGHFIVGVVTLIFVVAGFSIGIIQITESIRKHRKKQIRLWKLKFTENQKMKR